MKNHKVHKHKSCCTSRLNKKGDAALYFILIALLIFGVTFLFYMGRMEGSLQKVGENTIKVINTFEMSERLIFYIDASTELAARSAAEEVISTSGYLQERFKGKIVNSGCGTLTYPIIDVEKVKNSNDIDVCFPSYDEEFKILFMRNLNQLLLNYKPFDINPSDFDVQVAENREGLQITVKAGTNLNLPVYAYIESYYRDADKTKTSKGSVNTITKTEEGYLTMRGYSILNSFNNQGTTPSKIVIHDTKTTSVQETFAELQTGLKNYNYVIDTTGEIYEFAPETKRTRNSGCVKGGEGVQNTCIMEDTDRDSISIALVNKPSSSYHNKEQINSLVQLIADISSRNPTIEIKEGSIILYSEIDSSRLNDPSSDIVMQKAALISRAIATKNSKVLQSSTPANLDSPLSPLGEQDEDGTIHTPTRSIQGYAVYDPETDSENNEEDEELEKTNENTDSAEEIIDDAEKEPRFNSITGGMTFEITGYAVHPPDVNEENCFNDIKTTIYYTPDAEDKQGIWSSGKASCPNSYGYCCIPQSERGFYEEVMCQGSGVAGGRVYHYTTIGPSMSQSTPLADFERGITSTRRDPTPHRTVAADPNCPGFKYDSKLYIYFGEDNPWNGYYIVEDTGSAFKGNCNKMDIYVGVGQKALEEAAEYVHQNGKVCVLDDNFEMPDPDFSGSSTFIDPKTGEYSVSYSHSTQVSGLPELFDSTKQMLNSMINDCSQGTVQSKEQCLQSKMTGNANIEARFCDEKAKDKIWTVAEVSSETTSLIYSQINYKLIGTITNINADNTDLFSALMPAAVPAESPVNSDEMSDTPEVPVNPADALIGIMPQSALQIPNEKHTLIETFIQSPTSAILKFSDETGEIEVNISGNAVEWIDYLNKDSILYETGAFLKPGSKISMNVIKVKNSTHDGYYITDFSAIAEYPEEFAREEMIKLAKTIAECTTSSEYCICSTERTRMLGVINITGNEMSAIDKPENIIELPFTAQTSIYTNTQNEGAFTIRGAFVRASLEMEKSTLPACVPEKKYFYVCTSLKDREELGTIGYALKI